MPNKGLIAPTGGDNDKLVKGERLEYTAMLNWDETIDLQQAVQEFVY